MCHKLGKIITVQEANRQEEVKAQNNSPSYYCYYWRTNTGRVRETGYVLICKCGKFQYWGKTQKSLIERI
jgi:hypothetical protein